MEEKVLVRMNYGRGWETPSGVKFSREHPFQLVPKSELPGLLMEPRFKRARREDLLEHYQIKNIDGVPEDLSAVADGASEV